MIGTEPLSPWDYTREESLTGVNDRPLGKLGSEESFLKSLEDSDVFVRGRAKKVFENSKLMACFDLLNSLSPSEKEWINWPQCVPEHSPLKPFAF